LASVTKTTQKEHTMQNGVVTEDLKGIVGYDLNWQALAGKTVLISGANGFLPAYLVETLLYLNDSRRQEPVRVIAVVRNRAKAMLRFPDCADRVDFQLIVQDICQPLEIAGEVDYIIHAASQASPKFYGTDPVGTLSANILGTYNLLELARVKKVESFLFFSSGEVYGEVAADQIPTREDVYGCVNPLDVRSCYAESKRMGENMCVSWHHQHGVPAKIVRPFHTYGPGLSLDDGRVFADFVSDIVHGRNIVIQSDGSASRAFCYLSDATLGFFLVLLQGRNAEAYNVGNDRGELTILELANLMVGLFPEKGLRLVRQGEATAAGYLKSGITRNCPDISKIRSLGWNPTVTVAEGFARTVKSFLP
jgi:UDP-glucuronate decarboxylase